MLGDSIVDVVQLRATDQHRARATQLLFVLSALGLGAALVAFSLAVRSAARNAEALSAWLASGEPVWAFRPEAAAPGLALGFGVGGVVGIVALAIALARRSRDAAWSQAATALSADGTTRTLATMDAPLSTSPLVLGPARYFASAVEAPVELSPEWKIDHSFAPVLLGTAAAAGSAALVIGAVSPNATSLALDDGTAVLIVNKSASDERETTPPPPPDHGASETGASDSAPASARMQLAEGARGTDRPKSFGRQTVQKRSESLEAARTLAVENAATAGIIGSVAMQTGGMFMALNATTDLSSGFDEADLRGGFDGMPGEVLGDFGQGRRGMGPGNNGLPGVISMGNSYGVICGASQAKCGDGYNGLAFSSSRSGRPDRAPQVPTVKLKPPTVSGGGLDASIIKRHIQRSRNQLQYCYESQLQVQSGLTGTVTADFLIGPTGRVTSPRTSGVSAAVASCVATVVAQIQFPASAGSVQVRYPFAFSQAGS